MMTNMRDTRVMLADRAGPSHQAVAGVLCALPHTALVADVDDAASILPAVAAVRPDVLVVDDRLLRDASWTAFDLGVQLVVIGVDDDPAYRRRAERMGAVAWLPKERADADLATLVARGAGLRPRR
jgi:two-component system response regulator DesR